MVSPDCGAGFKNRHRVRHESLAEKHGATQFGASLCRDSPARSAGDVSDLNVVNDMAQTDDDLTAGTLPTGS